MTPKILADALGCFWNAAAGAARERQSLQAIEVADVMTAGFAAVANRLREHDEGESRRVSELLEENNRYQQEGRDAREALNRVLDTSGARGPYRALAYGDAVESAEALLAGIEPSDRMKFQVLRDALGAITDLSTALRQGGPAPEDLHGLSDALDTAITVALEALGETAAPADGPILARVQVAKDPASHPAAPWPAGGEDNAKRTGWAAFFAGHDREDCPFPPARDDLQRDYRVGWDAAKAVGQ